jgi:hypothetical protein
MPDDAVLLATVGAAIVGMLLAVDLAGPVPVTDQPAAAGPASTTMTRQTSRTARRTLDRRAIESSSRR